MLRRGLVLLAAIGVTGVLVPTVSSIAANSASAARPSAVGNMTANQNTFSHYVKVHGWAYAPGHPGKSIKVNIFVNGKYRGQTMTNRHSHAINHRYHLSGQHAYTKWVHIPGRAHSVSTRSHGYHGHLSKLALHRSAHWYPKPGRRITTVAHRYVGASYTWGGDSPSTGFDCSGFTKFVYEKAKVRSLPHQSESQRHVHGIRQLSASHARPGDLVFYMSGGDAYHVAVYTGDHRQISAVTESVGVEGQQIHHSNVLYGTITH